MRKDKNALQSELEKIITGLVLDEATQEVQAFIDSSQRTILSFRILVGILAVLGLFVLGATDFMINWERWVIYIVLVVPIVLFVPYIKVYDDALVAVARAYRNGVSESKNIEAAAKAATDKLKS